MLRLAPAQQSNNEKSVRTFPFVPPSTWIPADPRKLNNDDNNNNNQNIELRKIKNNNFDFLSWRQLSLRGIQCTKTKKSEETSPYNNDDDYGDVEVRIHAIVRVASLFSRALASNRCSIETDHL